MYCSFSQSHWCISHITRLFTSAQQLMQFSKQLVQTTVKPIDNLQKHVTCSKWIAPSSKASIHVNESVSVINLKSPDTSAYEQVQMALSCFFVMTVYSVNVFQCKKSQILTTWKYSRQHYTICTAICSFQFNFFFSQHCAKEKIHPYLQPT